MSVWEWLEWERKCSELMGSCGFRFNVSFVDCTSVTVFVRFSTGRILAQNITRSGCRKWNWAFSCRTRVGTAKKYAEEVYCTCRVIYFLVQNYCFFNLFHFLESPDPSGEGSCRNLVPRAWAGRWETLGTRLGPVAVLVSFDVRFRRGFHAMTYFISTSSF